MKYEATNKIICLAHPVPRDNRGTNRSRRRPERTTDETFPIWWNLEDGKVDFEDPRLRWFLGGREVESYECI